MPPGGLRIDSTGEELTSRSNRLGQVRNLNIPGMGLVESVFDRRSGPSISSSKINTNISGEGPRFDNYTEGQQLFDKGLGKFEIR